LPRFVPRILKIAKIISHATPEITIGLIATKPHEISVKTIPEKSIKSFLLSVSMPYPFNQDKGY
jgi:hypothetical protein